MNVLILTRGLPYPPNSGARIHDFHLIRELSRQARVVVCSIIQFQREIPDELRRLCHAVVTFRPKPHSHVELLNAIWRGWKAGRPAALNQLFFDQVAGRIRGMIEDHSIDIVQIEHSQLAGYVDAVPSNCKAIKLLSFHNLGWVQARRDVRLRVDSGHRALAIFNALTMWGWEPWYAERFDACVAVSEADAARLRRRNPLLRVAVIENGADCDRLRPLPETAKGSDLLFVGTLAYPPNADGILFFCDKILPIVRRKAPDARLVVVGREPPRALKLVARRDGVTLVDNADSVVPYYERARLCVVPLRAGSGTRLKILEAMALGRPVVTTSVGCEGLELHDGSDVLIADHPHDFAEQVLKILREPALGRQLARQARAVVESRYDWHKIGDNLLGLYRQLLAERAAPIRLSS